MSIICPTCTRGCISKSRIFSSIKQRKQHLQRGGSRLTLDITKFRKAFSEWSSKFRF